MKPVFYLFVVSATIVIAALTAEEEAELAQASRDAAHNFLEDMK